MLVYKIRDRETGLYSMGGAHQLPGDPGCKWSRTGKIWRGLGQLRNHLNQYEGRVPECWEVLVYEVQEKQVDAKPAREYLLKKP